MDNINANNGHNNKDGKN